MIRPRPVVRQSAYSSYNPNFETGDAVDPHELALQAIQSAPGPEVWDQRMEKLKTFGLDGGVLGGANRFGHRMAGKRQQIRADVANFLGFGGGGA